MEDFSVYAGYQKSGDSKQRHHRNSHVQALKCIHLDVDGLCTLMDQGFPDSLTFISQYQCPGPGDPQTGERNAVMMQGSCFFLEGEPLPDFADRHMAVECTAPVLNRLSLLDSGARLIGVASLESGAVSWSGNTRDYSRTAEAGCSLVSSRL